MNPVLALGLVAAAGIAVTRLPRLPLRQPPHFDLVMAAGTPLVLLGLLLGPGIGVLERPVLRALAPLTALAIGWIGAVFGSRFEWRFVRRIPFAVWALVLFQSVAVFVLVGGAAWLFLRLVPALAAAWAPALPAVLTLAAAATVSGPGIVALVAQGAGIRPAVAHAIGLAAALDTAFGALGFTLALALYHPNQPVWGAVLAWYEWLLVAAGSGLLVGVIFLWLSRLEPSRDITIPLLGSVLLGAGVGYAADLSPFVVCALAAALIVNFSPERRRVRQVLHDWEHPVYAVFLIIAGALLRLPTGWILVAVPVLAALRVLAKWAAVRFGRALLRAQALPPDTGFATVAQGGVALALGINFYITYGGAAAGAVVTTIVLGMAIAQLLAPPLMLRALRTAPAEPPGPPTEPVPETA
ncbi:MAG TPA: hypothetical protein VNI61_10350 [Gemmatimonadales bacterium]|nr:hypothetical protein [Gemmatimonadales bacterium]